MLTDEGYPKGAGWRLLREPDGLTGEIAEILKMEEGTADAGGRPHESHRHYRDEISSKYDWHYWIEDGQWFVEHMATGRRQSLREAILN